MKSKSLVILDRDGTINAKQGSNYVYELEKFIIFEDTLEFIKAIITLKFKVAIATNQRGISQNIFRLEDTLSLHDSLCYKLGINSSEFPIFVCSHSENSCECRKPKPGLIHSCLLHFSADPSQALFVGNSYVDYMTAKNANVDFIHIERDREDSFPKKSKDIISVSSMLEILKVMGLK